MAGLEGLASIIYHEKQQAGSMLCAQHALNNLLQGNYFTAPVLSDIAGSLDALEQHYDDANSGRSTNMDDTGFFSIQVLENALGVWGLSLVRWRSEAMRPYQDRPHTQLAFILNYEHHWYTLRRFGPALPNFTADPGHGHWFNLNSFHKSPDWVSKLYLGMVLQQAEADGYSVFAVIQADPSVPLGLPRTEADEIASTLPEPSSTTMLPSADVIAPTKPSSSTLPGPTDAPQAQAQTQPNLEHAHASDNLDDEDFELQAVLQASLMGDNAAPGPSPSTSSAAYHSIPGSWLSEPDSSSSPMQLSGAATPIRHTFGAPGEPPSHAPGTEVDPVAASMTRNRMIMERMRREQEMAQRELYEDEVARIGRRRNAGQEEEEEMLRRAIAESKAQAEIEGVEQPDDDDDADGEEVDLGGDDENLETSRYAAARSPYSASRVYDDDDEGLQRALKASLETVPEGFTAELPPLPTRTMPAEIQVPAASATNEEEETDSMDTSSEAEASVPSAEQQEVEAVSVDELRKRRLARFGG